MISSYSYLRPLLFLGAPYGIDIGGKYSQLFVAQRRRQDCYFLRCGNHLAASHVLVMLLMNCFFLHLKNCKDIKSIIFADAGRELKSLAYNYPRHVFLARAVNILN